MPNQANAADRKELRRLICSVKCTEMDKMTFQNRIFRYQIASDVIRDGIAVELWEEKGGREVFVAEVFRNDHKKIVEFSEDVQDLPFEALQELLNKFHKEIPQDFQD